MRDFDIVKMSFSGPLHLGKGLGEAYDTSEKMLRSDTISGALASVFCQLFGSKDLPAFMEQYQVSSAFPFAGENMFLPMPQQKLQIEFTDVDAYGQLKKLKKIEYIESSLWQRLICGETLSCSVKCLSADGRFLFADPAKVQMVYRDDLQQRVFVPRSGDDAVPFYLERRYFAPACGLYFFIETANDETKRKVKILMDWLGTQGIGTDKSVGNGHFEASFSKVSLDLPKQANARVLISLTCPEPGSLSEELLQASTYQLVKRGGFIAGTNDDRFRHLRKKSVYMFTEGSVFVGKAPQGKIEDVRPDWNDAALHPVFRDGRAFYLPINHLL